jgi:hypothetical protein
LFFGSIGKERREKEEEDKKLVSLEANQNQSEDTLILRK